MSLEEFEGSNLTYIFHRLQDNETRNQVISVIKGESPCSTLDFLQRRMNGILYANLEVDINVAWRAEGFKALKYPMGKYFVKYLRRQLTNKMISHSYVMFPCGMHFLKFHMNNTHYSFHDLVLDHNDIGIINYLLVATPYEVIMRTHPSGQFHVKLKKRH
ncbi:Hypothetical protein POVR1_LOCUS317 [uncultured virus]|nr:Hypothetical protein POVR1_LOCUS317 [uncultured virus]